MDKSFQSTNTAFPTKAQHYLMSHGLVTYLSTCTKYSTLQINLSKLFRISPLYHTSSLENGKLSQQRVCSEIQRGDEVFPLLRSALSFTATSSPISSNTAGLNSTPTLFKPHIMLLLPAVDRRLAACRTGSDWGIYMLELGVPFGLYPCISETRHHPKSILENL